MTVTKRGYNRFGPRWLYHSFLKAFKVFVMNEEKTCFGTSWCGVSVCISNIVCSFYTSFLPHRKSIPKIISSTGRCSLFFHSYFVSRNWSFAVKNARSFVSISAILLKSLFTIALSSKFHVGYFSQRYLFC